MIYAGNFPKPLKRSSVADAVSLTECLVLAGLEMLATQRALTWAERCAHADLARRVDAVR